MPTISVIVPVYNVEKYLNRCVDSILNQTFTDFELILVNDGSTDKSGEICEEYKKSDPRIKVIHQKNQGQASARNKGIDASTGKYIFFVDSDDYINVCTLKNLFDAVQKYNVPISICEVEDVYDYIEHKEVSSYSSTVFSSMDFYFFRCPLVHMPVCKLFLKSLFDNYRFPEGKIHEDVFLIYKILYEAEKVVYIDCNLYYYFKNPFGTMGRPYSLKRLDEVEAGEQQVEFFKSKKGDINYPESLKRLMYYYSYHIGELKKIPEGKKYARKLRIKLVKLLLSKSRFCKVSIKSNPDYYEKAFPAFMFVYWQIKRFL